MQINPFDFLVVTLLLLIYGWCLVVSLLFAFAFKTYTLLNEKLNFDIIIIPDSNPINVENDKFDSWLSDNHVLVGIVLALFSLLELIASFDIINNL